MAGTLLLVLLGLCGSPVAAQERLDHLSLVEKLGEDAVAEMLAGLDLEPGMTIHIAPEAPHDANWFVTHILARELKARGCEVILVPGVEATPLPATPPTPTVQPTATEPAATEPLDAEEEELEEDEFGEEDEDQTGDDDMSADEGNADDEEQAAEDEEPDEQEPLGPARRQARQAAQAAAQQAAAQTTVAAGSAATHTRLELPTQGDLLTFRLIKFGITYASMKRAWFVGPQEIERIAEVRLQGTLVREPGHVLLGAASGDQVALDRFPSQARKVLEGHAYPFEIVQPPEKSLTRFIEPAFVVGIISGLVYLFSENQK